ncbi:hypothetical protein Tco_0172595 [Tanacetum coccineum]
MHNDIMNKGRDVGCGLAHGRRIITPLENIIGSLDRPVSTRLQLYEQALFCYYDAFLTSVEPKNYKEALTQACWIEAIQEELHEFERLEVWNCPPPDKHFSSLLKWSIMLNLMIKELAAIRIFLHFAAAHKHGPSTKDGRQALRKLFIWVETQLHGEWTTPIGGEVQTAEDKEREAVDHHTYRE